MKLILLERIFRRLRMRKQPKPEGQPILIAQETIDNLLSKELENQQDLEELLDSIIEDRVREIQELNETLRGKN
jgi:RNase P protein component